MCTPIPSVVLEDLEQIALAGNSKYGRSSSLASNDSEIDEYFYIVESLKGKPGFLNVAKEWWFPIPG